MEKSKWYGLKASLCDAFDAVVNAEGMKEGDQENVLALLSVLNEYLEKDTPDD